MCYHLNLDGYGPHPSQGDKVLGLPPGASCVNKSNSGIGLVREEPPRLGAMAGTKISKCRY